MTDRKRGFCSRTTALTPSRGAAATSPAYVLSLTIRSGGWRNWSPASPAHQSRWGCGWRYKLGDRLISTGVHVDVAVVVFGDLG